MPDDKEALARLRARRDIIARTLQLELAQEEQAAQRLEMERLGVEDDDQGNHPTY